jgi:hypothetical protein
MADAIAEIAPLGVHTGRDPEAGVRGVLRFPGGSAALAAAARRLDASPAAVALSCCARALADELAGEDTLFHVMSSNRHLPGVARLVTPMSQWVPLLLRDVRDGAMEDLVRRTKWSALAALRHGAYDPDAYADARGIGREAGEGAWDGFFFNFLPSARALTADPADESPTVTTAPPTVRTGPVFYLVIREGSPLTVICRTMVRSVGPATVGRLLHRIHDLLAELCREGAEERVRADGSR